MKIKNKTTYDDKILRKMFQEALTKYPLIKGKDLIVELVYSNQGWWISGWAYIGKVYGKKTDFEIKYLMRLKLPRPQKLKQWREKLLSDPTPVEREIALTFIHEAMHCAGGRHKDMRGGYFHRPDKALHNDPGYTKLAWADKHPPSSYCKGEKSKTIPS